MYGKPFKEFFTAKIEMVQYWAALVITGVIKGTSQYRLYQERKIDRSFSFIKL